MSTEHYTPDPRIAPYLAALAINSVVSLSHVDLMRAYGAHGKPTIDRLLAEHWDKVRNDS